MSNRWHARGYAVHVELFIHNCIFMIIANKLLEHTSAKVCCNLVIFHRQSMQACWDQASDYMSKYSDSLPTRTVNELQMSIKGALERIKTHVEAQASPVSQHGCTTRPYSSRPGQERNVAGTITLLLGRIEGHLNDERFVEAMSNLKAVGRLLRNVQSNNRLVYIWGSTWVKQTFNSIIQISVSIRNT